MENNGLIELDLDKVEVPENWIYEVDCGINLKKYKPNVKQIQKDIKAELIKGVEDQNRIQEWIYNHPLLKPYAIYPRNYPV